jgi:NAD+ synthase (glutamine-hydrolysing)
MISIAQMYVHAGQPEKNLATMKESIRQAKEQGSELVVFPELALPGYMLGDEWENESFVGECEDMNHEIIDATREHAMAAIWGNVKTDPTRVNEDGRLRKYNAAWVAQNGILVPGGQWDGSTVKTLMPNYREFRDKRHFTSLRDVAFEEGKSIREMGEYYQPFELLMDGVKRKVGVIICEDMWDDDYAVKPVKLLRQNGADKIVNISASPYGIGKQGKRDRLLARQSEGIDLIYANHVWVQNNGKNIFVFDGASPVYRDGKKVFQSPSFREWVFPVDETITNGESEIEKISTALITGFRDFMKSIGQTKVVIWLSGWVDSALVAMITVLAMGKENVITLNMPSEYNSETTKSLAREFASELGIEYQSISIQKSVENTRNQIEETFGVSTAGLISENIQARDRGARLLAWVAASLGAVFTNNGNKTEVAQGYATLYGDVNGSIAPIADLYKTQVFELTRYLAKKYGISTLEKIAGITPSAELSFDQSVDEGKWDPFIFEYHDKLLYQLIEMRQDPADILEALKQWNLDRMIDAPKAIIGTDGYFPTNEAFIADLERIWKNYKLSFFKRIQAPPILTVSRRAFGYDLEEAQNGVYFSRRYRELSKILLSHS